MYIPAPSEIEKNSFLSFCFHSAIFYDLIYNSKKKFDSLTQLNEEIFRENNKQNAKNYEAQKNLLLNFTEEAEAHKLSKIKSIIGLDINKLKDKENDIENILEEIRKKIIFNLKNFMSPKISPNNVKFNQFMSVYFSDYIIETLIFFYHNIKLMKKNGDKKLADLAAKYLYEEDKKDSNLQNQIRSLKNQIKIMIKNSQKN